MESTRILMCLLALICVSNALSSVDVTKAKKEEEIFLRQIYNNLDKGIRHLTRESLKYALRTYEEKSQEFNISSRCKGNVFKIVSGLRNLELWAVNFIDASGKLNDGILSGNFFMYGNYDQCLNSSALKKSGTVDFRGQYCLVSFHPYLPKSEFTPDRRERVALVKNITRNMIEPIAVYIDKVQLFEMSSAKFGLCVPTGCDATDVNEFIKYVGKHIFMNLTLDFCETEESRIYFTPTRTVILCIYSFFILLVIIGSVIERYSTARNIKFQSPVMRSLISFSFPYNFKKFTSTKVTEENLIFLNGIRVLTLFYIILSHHYIMKALTLMFRNIVLGVQRTLPRFFFQIIINGTFSVDVFFFIGGFLNCYIRAKKNFTYFSFSSSFMIVVHRLIRIFPIYIFSVLIGFLFRPLGPVAHDIAEKSMNLCTTEWWQNILFINNFYHPFEQCAGHSWYLAADMQLFLVSLFTIPPLFQKPKIGVLLNLAIILLCTVFTSVRSWTENMIPTSILDLKHSQEDIENWMMLLFSPITHVSSYFGGVLLGFFIAKKKNSTIPKIALVCGWMVSTTVALTVLFISKRWNSGIPYTQLESALYASLSRPLFSCSIGWLIFCCVSGHGGIVNSILSWKVWIILNRLGLSAYILSFIVQLYYFANLRTSQDFQHEIEIWNYFGDVAVSLLLSFALTMLIESPFIGLEKVMFGKKDNASGLKENEMKIKEDIKLENGIKCDKNKNSTEI